MKRIIPYVLIFVTVLMFIAGCASTGQIAPASIAENYAYDIPVLPANLHDIKSFWSDGAWQGLSLASDGNLYLGLCTHAPDINAAVLRFDLSDGSFGTFQYLGRLLRIRPGENQPMSHGKIHTPFFEHDGKLYFATHFGPVNAELHEKRPFGGGALIALDMETEGMEIIAKAPTGEGIITLAANFDRNAMYGVVIPSGKLLVFDIESGEVSDAGVVETERRESPRQISYADPVRQLAVDPTTGRVFGSRRDGSIWYYDPADGDIHETELDLKSAIFGPASEAALANSIWRMIIRDPESGVFYGTHRGTGSLFRFDPAAMTIEPLARVTTWDDLDSPSAGNAPRLAMAMRDGVIYHLAHGPAVQIEDEGRRAVRYQVHLVTCDTRTGERVDHGALMAGDRRVLHTDTLAMMPDGRLFTLAFVELTDPVLTWQLIHHGRGSGANRTVAGAYFEMALVEILPVQ